MQGVAPVDEQTAGGRERGCDALPGTHAGSGVSAAEGAHPDRERQVERWLAGAQFEVLDGHVAHAQQSGRDLCRGVALGACDPRGGPVDDENVPVPDSLRHRFGGASWRAADLQHPHARAQRQRVDHGSEPLGQASRSDHGRPPPASACVAGPTTE
jgi:hypothetical protein